MENVIEDVIISIIVPVYNSEQHLADCLESIRKQSYDKIEIIIIDDGSTDRSSFILKEYSKIDGRITIISQSNSGSGEARNRGIDYSHGDYLVFVDSDDILVENCVEKIVDVVKKNSFPDLVCFGYKTFGEGKESIFCPKEKVYSSGAEYIKEIVSSLGGAGAVCGRVYKTSVLKSNEIHFKGFKTAEDGHFNTVCLQYINKVVSTDYIGYLYRKEEYYIHSSTKFFNRPGFFRSSVDSCSQRLEQLRLAMRTNNVNSVEDITNYYYCEWYSFNVVNDENSVYNSSLKDKLYCNKMLLESVLSEQSIELGEDSWRKRLLFLAYYKKSGLLLLLWNYSRISFLKKMIVMICSTRLFPKNSGRGQCIRKILKR